MSRRLTTEEFIEKAIRIHGDKYDYSLVEYENASKRVRIKCNTCGNVFDQVPATHLSGHGCPVCAQATVVHKLREKRGMTTDKYIARAREVHGDKYDYSKVNYVNANTKVEIVCPVHGLFFQAPFSHLQGNGCAECSKLTTDVFVGRLRERYGDRFDYTDTVYVDLRTPVTLKCNTCGSIITRNYQAFVRSVDFVCPTCAERARGDAFVSKAKKKYGDRFDYSQVDYHGKHVPVKIKCNTCGSWLEQTPSNHLRRGGCIVCQRNARRSSTDEFIEKARFAHGDKYDYGLVQYENNKEKVSIKCNTCGHVFEQSPYGHLSGYGCPVCAMKDHIVRLREAVDARRLTLDTFLERAKLAHGNKYDYSLVRLVDATTKVIIKCNTCGHVFEQSPYLHLSGSGCPSCARKSQASKLSKSESEFFDEVRRAHGDDYDYSEAKYTGWSNKIKIKCNACGHVFWQEAGSHLRGAGCPACALRKAQMTRLANGRGSKSEDNMYSRLCCLFGKDDVERQYGDGRYPFNCDFYIKSRDMFIELNAFYMHGSHWFDVDNDLDVLFAEGWFDKLDVSSVYSSALRTWMYSDVEKRETARKNDLNYVVFWDNDLKDFETWVEAGCPDSHDWEREYAWRFGPEARKADTEGEGVARPERVQPAPDVA